MATQVWYAFHERGTGEDEGRLLIPHADGRIYENPFDYGWDTPEEAYEALQEMVDEEQEDFDEVSEWVLTRKTVEGIEPASARLVRPAFMGDPEGGKE